MNINDLVQYCRSQDWGKDARCIHTPDGLAITGLREVSTEPTGEVIVCHVTLPADYKIISGWANH